MNIFIRKRNSKYSVVLEYRHTDNKLKQKTLASFDKKKEAEKKLTEEKQKLYTDNFIMPEKITLYQYMINWLTLKRNNISITTYDRYLSIIENDIRENIGKAELQKVTPLMVETFYIGLSKRLTPKTILQYHRILHKAYNDAKKKKLVNKNIIEYVDPPKAQKYKADILNVEEALLLLNSCKNTRLEIPINLALGLGLRAGEILALTWDRINFSNNTIMIDRSMVLNRATKQCEFSATKSESSTRLLTCPGYIINLLKEQRKKEIYSKVSNLHGLIFAKVDGTAMSSASFSRLFRDFLKRNNLKLVRFHDLRHTHASLQLLGGTSLKVVSNRLGHSSISITGDIYTHVLQQLDTKAVDNISNILYKKNI